ncbi:ornithine carbamoyltransferase [Microbulbifer thermotolerans]|uniref:Ornithine carbamoyltransferase n=1 Tax=Microbulbifer thermotolerans TaxID=252514 RepID=A0AB35I0Y9_MICTH|nr:ornithine carbamoyltransferase [Microbulbifer thermotolerans]MCX2778922.1 ornithine carbamoyltransferase [Microbulbifer thermotolerans]MCX2781446.1 ornithine carbamoyltransferase [Microbulbifer thermotolerans]MCX2793808.1 ornithine carbamoyltransferase [Microbulbifer thermotolerans]MCX2802368.1 ornithine carbamoyltransferase [Microbulbifer thermotolerans]MCX2804227.1 ornithine carbamoyltransferase [Microbulbifer thermotolerans]
MAIRHFLTLLDLSKDELNSVIERAIELKALRAQGIATTPFRDKVLGMIFEKSSTRTRVSFEAGMAQMGGSALFLSPRDTQLGRGEPIEDSARVISRMVDMVMIRTFGHNVLERFAEYSRVPVINALSDSYHPCQLLADIQTYVEHRGSPAGKVVAWVGDGNNMCHSYINAARQCDFELRIACPEGYEPEESIVAAAGDRVRIMRKPAEAVRGADWVATDVWASMGQETEQKERERAFQGFLVDHELMSHANSDAVFMHCLPAHRGEEVSGELLEDETISVVWDEAENRLHAQKALMEFLQENSE